MVDDGADVRVVDGRRRRRRHRHGRISRMSCKMSGHDDEQWRRRLGLARPAFAQPSYGLRPPASSNAFPINTTESGHRHPCVLCIWKIMRSYLSAVRQDLLVRDSPSAFAKGLRDLVLCSFNYLLACC